MKKRLYHSASITVTPPMMEQTADISHNPTFRESMLSSLRKVIISLRPQLWLLLLGVTSECIYFFYLLHDFPLIYYFQIAMMKGSTTSYSLGTITNYSIVSFFTFFIAFSCLFILFILAIWQVRKFHNKATIWIIFSFSGIFTLTSIFIYPITSIDIFLYIARGLVMVQYQANPLITPPGHFATDPLIVTLTHGFSNLPSAYGPLCLIIQALPVMIAGRNILVSVLLTKLMFSTILLASTFLVYKILSQIAPSFALVGLVALAWNPFTLFQYSVNSHNDIAMMFFVALAVFALVQERPVWALTLVTASGLIKFASFTLFPLFFIYGFVHQPNSQRRILYIIKAFITSLALIIISFAPFWTGPQILQRFLQQVQDHRYSFSMFLYYALSKGISIHQIELVGWVLFGGCFLYALWLSSRDLLSLLKGCFITLFALLALSANYVQPWYLIWPLMLAILVPQTEVYLAAIFLAYAGILAALVRQYIDQWGVSTWTSDNGTVYLAFFLPAVLILIVSRFPGSEISFRKVIPPFVIRRKEVQ